MVVVVVVLICFTAACDGIPVVGLGEAGAIALARAVAVNQHITRLRIERARAPACTRAYDI